MGNVALGKAFRLIEAFRALDRENELSLSHVAGFLYIAANEGELGPMGLKDPLDVSPGTATRIVSRLGAGSASDKAGKPLKMTTEYHVDGRQKRIELTMEGRAFVERIENILRS